MTSHWSEQKWLVLYVFVIFILSIIFAWGHSILQYFTRENLNKTPYWVGRFGLHEFLVEHLLKLEVAMSLQEFSLCGTVQCKWACYWKPYWKPWWNGWITCLRRRGLGRNLNGEAPNFARIVWLSKGTNVLRESPNRGQDLSLVMSGIWSLIGLTLCQHNRGWTWTGHFSCSSSRTQRCPFSNDLAWPCMAAVAPHFCLFILFWLSWSTQNYCWPLLTMNKMIL